MGLLVLRTTLGITVATHGALLLLRSEKTPVLTLTSLAGVLAGALLIIGLLTAVASVTAGLLCASSSFAAYPIDCGTAAVLGAAIGVALTLLGPGASSADARLFGPREVLIPATRRPSAQEPG